MRILVTGCGGFVAPYLVRELRSAGYDVFGTDRNPSACGELEEENYFRADLRNEDDLEKLLDRARCDAVIHLAGWSHVGSSWKYPLDAMSVNVETSVRLYQHVSKRIGSTGRFIYVSSADVYGRVKPSDLPLEEMSILRPDSPYAVSKLAAEQMLELLRRVEKTPMIVVRPFNHTGPGQSDNFVCPALAKQVAELESGQIKVVRHGDLRPKRDFLDVRDVARAYRLILEKGKDCDLFVLARGKSISIEEILLTFFELAGVEPRHETDEKLIRPIDVPEFRGNYKNLYSRTGWKPEIPLRETLRDLLENARRNVRAVI